MNNPFGYYINRNPDDSKLLRNLQASYGAYLQGISVREKLFLIRAIADNLLLRANGEIHKPMYSLQHEIFRLPTSEQEGLIEALIAQLRSS